MADFIISGIVELAGSSGTLVGAELDYNFFLGEFSFSLSAQGHRESGLLYTDQDGAFSVGFEVPDPVAWALGGNAALLLTVRPHFPAPEVTIQTLLQGSASENFQQAQDLSNGLEITFDIAASQTATLEFDLRDDVEALEDDQDLRLHLMSGSGGDVLATALARRINASRFQARVFYLAGAFAPDDCWILLHDGDSYRPVGWLDSDEVGQVFARTWKLPLANLDEVDANRLLLMQVDSATGVGTVSSQLPEQITQGPLIGRDLDLDFIDGQMRVRGRLGVGINGFQLFEVGRFETFFTVTPPDRKLTPYTTDELASPVDLTIVEKKFDIFPGTDLNNIGGMSGIEAFLANQVATSLRDIIQQEIAAGVEEQIDQVFDQIEATLAWTADPEETVNEIRSTLFIHIDDVRLTADNFEVRAFAGIWHWVANLASLDCAANTASVMFASRRPLPMFRRYQKALSGKSLQPWVERYEKLSPELARIARRDPQLTSRVIRIGFDLLPVLHPRGKVPLPPEAAEELAVLARRVARNASPELASFVEHVSKVLERGAGRTIDELTHLAAEEARRQPPR
jgi:hypothetical protein